MKKKMNFAVMEKKKLWSTRAKKGKCHNGLSLFFFLSKACEGKRGGLRPWLAAAVADDDGSAGFWFFFFFRGALFCWPWNTRGKRREKEYKSRCCGPAGSKRAGGTRNGNDSLQGSLSLSLSFSLVFILRFLFFLLKSNLRRLKEKKP